MARPQKQVVDYFPHYCNHKKTMFILEERYGNNGYAFWFKLLEMLGNTKGHCIDLGDPSEMEFLLAKTHCSEVSGLEMLDLLAKLDAIDREAWEHKAVWCQNFIDGVAPVYQNRQQHLPQKPSFQGQKPTCAEISTSRNVGDAVVSMVENTQSRVEDSRVEDSRIEGGMGETPEDLNPIEEEMLNLKSWGVLTESDRQWVAKFTQDYPKTTDIDVRECGDYWYGRADRDKKVTHSKAQWRNRLRNWMKGKPKFEGGPNGRKRIAGNIPSGAFRDIET